MKAGLALLCLALALASLALGPVDLLALWARDPALAQTLFVELRLPRAGLALAIGAGLGASGAAAQGLFRNPLASPDVLGPSSGAALGAVLAGYFAGAGVIGMAVGGLAGAGLSLLLLLALAGRGAGATRLVLAGVAVSMLLGVAITLALAGALDVDAAIVALRGAPGEAITPMLAGAILALPVLLNTSLKLAVVLVTAGRAGWTAAGSLAAAALAMLGGYGVVASLGWLG